MEMSTTTAGLNLHHDCWNGIFSYFNLSAIQILQVIFMIRSEYLILQHIYPTPQSTRTHIDKFLPDDQINDLIQGQEESKVVTKFLHANSDKEPALIKLSRQQYALEHVLSSR